MYAMDVMGYWSEGVPRVTKAHRTPFDAQSFIIVTQMSEVEQAMDVMGYWSEGVPWLASYFFQCPIIHHCQK